MYENSDHNVNNQSEQMLEPISIDNNEPIVSLKEACKPVHDLVDHLSSAVKFSMRNTEKYVENLSKDESASILLFTLKWPQPLLSFSSILNQTLQSPDRNSLIPWMPYLKLFLTALIKLPEFNGTVWYCVKQDLSELYQDGEKRIWWGVTSCTSSLALLDTEHDGPCTLFSIETLQGKYIGTHSYLRGNEDVLLLPGIYFRAAGQLKRKDGLNIVHLKEQQPSYPLVELPFQVTETLEEDEQSDISLQSTVSEKSGSLIDKTTTVNRPKTAVPLGPRTCSVCLQTLTSSFAYRIEPPADTCTHKNRPRRVCDYCLYQHVLNMLHPSITDQVSCPELGCSRQSILSDEHIRRVLLHGGSKALWNSRQNVRSRSTSSARWVQQNALPCPKCRSPIIKSGGCDRMICARCSHQFLWSEASVNGWRERPTLSRPSSVNNTNK